MRKLLRQITGAVLVALTSIVISSCHKAIDDIPPAGVWIVFPYQHDWELHGVTAALQHKEFILSEGKPEGFNYSASSQTGFGGVLLVGDINGNPAAYDLACPIEKNQNIRIQYDDRRNDAYCAHCGSRFSVINNYGKPTEGPAAEKDNLHVLRTYNIATGPNGEYRVIRP